MKRPKDRADQSRELRGLRRLEPDDFPREAFTLPLLAALLQARKIVTRCCKLTSWQRTVTLRSSVQAERKW
jgi:hypothetical protein